MDKKKLLAACLVITFLVLVGSQPAIAQKRSVSVIFHFSQNCAPIPPPVHVHIYLLNGTLLARGTANASDIAILKISPGLGIPWPIMFTAKDSTVDKFAAGNFFDLNSSGIIKIWVNWGNAC